MKDETVLSDTPIMSLMWRDTLHSPYFQDLVQCLLECFYRHGVLDDIPEEDIPLIARLSVQHDIGKLWLPDTIVNKPGRLSPEENAAMKTHPMLGACIVEEMYQDWPKPKEYTYLYAICRHHHERWDGSGYPDGLVGDKVPRYVQIISMADALDALLTKRSYRPAMDWDDAVSLVIKGGCGVFAPQLRAIFDLEINSVMREAYSRRKEANRKMRFHLMLP